MELKSILIMCSFVMLLGVFTGLFMRVLRESEQQNLGQTFILSVQYLIIYPILFPLMVLKNREAIAENLAKKWIKREKANKSELPIFKSAILKRLSMKRIFNVWIKLLKDIFNEEYITQQIAVASQDITRSSYKLRVTNSKGMEASRYSTNVLSYVLYGKDCTV